MGVIHTGSWIKEEKTIAEGLREHIPLLEEREGMPPFLRQVYEMASWNKKSYAVFEKRQVFRDLDNIFLKYKKKLEGPDVPIFLFPICSVFSSYGKKMSGVAYKDMVFLFSSPYIKRKDLETLFVHEYHHVCRLSIPKINKKQTEASLLDSLIMEGLAEVAVKEFCGVRSVAPWTLSYSKATLKNWFFDVYRDNLHVKQGDKLHDELLYGSSRTPFMLGYALGYYIVNTWLEVNKSTTLEMKEIDAEEFVNHFLEYSHKKS